MTPAKYALLGILIIMLIVGLSTMIQYIVGINLLKANFYRSDGYFERALYLVDNGKLPDMKYAPMFSILLVPVTLLPSTMHEYGIMFIQTVLMYMILLYSIKINNIIGDNIHSTRILIVIGISCSPLIINWYLTGQSDIFQASILTILIYKYVSAYKNKKSFFNPYIFVLYVMLLLTKPIYAYLAVLPIIAKRCHDRFKYVYLVINAIIAIVMLNIIPRILTPDNERATVVTNNPVREIYGGTIALDLMRNMEYYGYNFSKDLRYPMIADSTKRLLREIHDPENSQLEQYTNMIKWHIDNIGKSANKVLSGILLWSVLADTQQKTIVLILTIAPIWILGTIAIYQFRRKDKVTNIFIYILLIHSIIHIMSLPLARYALPIMPILYIYAANSIKRITKWYTLHRRRLRELG